MAASFLGKLLVKIEGDNSSLDKSINKSEKTTKKFSKFAIAAYAAIGIAILALSKKAVKAFAVQEQAEAKLNATIKSTGQAAGLTSRELLNMASGLQQVTKFGDEAIIGAETLLLTFKDIGGDIFPRALESILDVSEAMGQGLKESTIQLGKALNDPIQGLTAMRRVGIQFTDAQEDTIKSMVKMNDLAGAQNVILTELESQFGGVARAAADTATGSLTQLGNIFGDLQESFGQSIAEGINPFVKGLTNVITQMVEARKEARNLKEALNIVDEGGLITAEQTLLILENQRDKLGQIAAQYEGLDEAANEAFENAKRQIEDFNEALTFGKDTFVLAEEAKQKALEQTALDEDERKKISIEAFKTIAQLQFDSLSADEQKIIELQAQINKWADLRGTVAGAEELFQELARQRNEIQKELNENLEEEEELIIKVSDAQALALAEGMIGIGRQAVAIKDLSMDYESLANETLTVLASAFSNVGDVGADAWEVTKQAGKDAISTVIEGFAKQWILQAAAALIPGFGFNPLAAAGYIGLAGAAFAASSFVQNLAEGGVIQPATGGVPAVMAEAGVPEMAMPLTSSAINPFADAVASRISTTTNNNTQNFNSMFSLNDENKMREVARRLFPFLRDEEQRRGILV